MSTPNSRSGRLAADTKIVSGLTQNQAGLPTLLILGQTYTVAQALTVLQTRIAKATASATAKAAATAAAQAEEQEIASTKAFVSALTTQLRVWFENAPDKLATFGLAQKKSTATKSPVTKVLATAKRLATRKERNTMGTEQRKLVKGTIPATITIAAPAGSAQVESAAPAPSVDMGQTVSASHGVSTAAPSGSAPKPPTGQ